MDDNDRPYEQGLPKWWGGGCTANKIKLKGDLLHHQV